MSLQHPDLKGFHVTICFILVLFQIKKSLLQGIDTRACTILEVCTHRHFCFCHLVGNNDVSDMQKRTDLT